MKNKHECPLKNSHVETRGSQTCELPFGTVFEANELPSPDADGSNVFYARPYVARLNTHDEESGPFQHSTEATAASVPRELNMASAGGHTGHRWVPPEGSYSHNFPSDSFRGISSTTCTTGNAVGVENPVAFGQGPRTMGSAVGVMNRLTHGQDDRQVYSGGGGSGGGGGSTQLGEQPWQRRGQPSVQQQRGSNYMDGTAGIGWPMSLGNNRPPGGGNSRRNTVHGGEGSENTSDSPSPSSALSSMAPTSTLPMPPPSPDVDRWRRNNTQVQRPSVSVALSPRMQDLERIFSEGFTRTSLGPSPMSEEGQERDEGKEAGRSI